MAWGAILGLKDLELEPYLVVLFSGHEHKIEKFVTDDVTMSGGPGPGGARESKVKVLVRLCNDANVVSHMMLMTKIRWLFLVLVIGDLQSSIFGAKATLSKAYEQEIQRVLDRESEASGASGSLTGLVNLKEISRLLVAAHNLAWLCEKLGVGCIFFLYHTLSQHL